MCPKSIHKLARTAEKAGDLRALHSLRAPRRRPAQPRSTECVNDFGTPGLLIRSPYCAIASRCLPSPPRRHKGSQMVMILPLRTGPIPRDFRSAVRDDNASSSLRHGRHDARDCFEWPCPPFHRLRKCKRGSVCEHSAGRHEFALYDAQAQWPGAGQLT